MENSIKLKSNFEKAIKIIYKEIGCSNLLEIIIKFKDFQNLEEFKYRFEERNKKKILSEIISSSSSSSKNIKNLERVYQTDIDETIRNCFKKEPKHDFDEMEEREEENSIYFNIPEKLSSIDIKEEFDIEKKLITEKFEIHPNYFNFIQAIPTSREFKKIGRFFDVEINFNMENKNNGGNFINQTNINGVVTGKKLTDVSDSIKYIKKMFDNIFLEKINGIDKNFFDSLINCEFFKKMSGVIIIGLNEKSKELFLYSNSRDSLIKLRNFINKNEFHCYYFLNKNKKDEWGNIQLANLATEMYKNYFKKFIDNENLKLNLNYEIIEFKSVEKMFNNRLLFVYKKDERSIFEKKLNGLNEILEEYIFFALEIKGNIKNRKLIVKEKEDFFISKNFTIDGKKYYMGVLTKIQFFIKSLEIRKFIFEEENIKGIFFNRKQFSNYEEICSKGEELNIHFKTYIKKKMFCKFKIEDFNNNKRWYLSLKFILENMKIWKKKCFEKKSGFFSNL